MKQKILEADVLKSVKLLLGFHQAQKHLAWRRINVGAKLFNTSRGPKFIKNTEMVGLPDILVWLRNGPVLSWELKSPIGKLSEEQNRFKLELESLGHCYFVIRDVLEAKLCLEHFGIL